VALMMAPGMSHEISAAEEPQHHQPDVLWEVRCAWRVLDMSMQEDEVTTLGDVGCVISRFAAM